ncbi:MAG: hypothetical protein U0176_24465 [Bacteroidia bacterium]
MASIDQFSFNVLLGLYPEDIQQRFLMTRAWLLDNCPDLQEEADATSNVVGYLLGPGYKGSVCTLILSKLEIKLGLAYSANFDDPNGLLQGKGKVHRHVPIPAGGHATVIGLAELLEQAIDACRARLSQ